MSAFFSRVSRLRAPIQHNHPAARSKGFPYVVKHQARICEFVIGIRDEDGVDRFHGQVWIIRVSDVSADIVLTSEECSTPQEARGSGRVSIARTCPAGPTACDSLSEK